MNSLTTEIVPEVQAEASSAIVMTLSGIFAQLSNDNINTMLLMSEKKNIEDSRTGVKNMQSKQESGTQSARYPVIEARQKGVSEEINKRHKLISEKLEERQVVLRKSCDQIAAKIVPEILNGCVNMLASREDTKSKEDINNLNTKLSAVKVELEDMKKSLRSVSDSTNNLLAVSSSHLSNAESVTNQQKSELNSVRKQCLELGQRVDSHNTILEGVRKQCSELEQKQFVNLGSRLQKAENTLPKVEMKVQEMGSTLSKLQSQQEKSEEKAAQEKTESENAFNNFKNGISKQLSESKSTTPQPGMQHTVNDAPKLSKRVDILEANSKAHSATVNTLEKLIPKDSTLKSIPTLSKTLSTLLSEQEMDSKRFATFEQRLREVNDSGTATAELVATKSKEIGDVQTRVDSSITSQTEALEKLAERISLLEKSSSGGSPNTESESTNAKTLPSDLDTVKNEIEGLKAQLKDIKEVQTSVSSTTTQSIPGADLEAAIEELNSSIEAQFEGLEDSFGQEVNSLKRVCKEAKDGIDQLKKDLNAQTLGANLQTLEGRVDGLVNQINSIWTDHGQRLNSIDQSVAYLKSSSQANAHAVMNLDSRYSNITTADIYKGMSDAFSQDMFPKVDQLFDLVNILQSRTQALESGNNTSKQSESIADIQLRLGNVEATSKANSSATKKLADLKRDLDQLSELMANEVARLKGMINKRHTAGQNGDGVNGAKKRIHSGSPKPSQTNGQNKRARVADSEEQDELDL